MTAREGGPRPLPQDSDAVELAEAEAEAAEQVAAEFLRDALREEQAKRAEDAVHGHLAMVPEREALAITLSAGLDGHRPHYQAEIARYIGAASQQATSYTIKRARARLRYVMTRPEIDPEALAQVLSGDELETVREVYATASFAAVARRRCPGATTRTLATRVRRTFGRAIAKVERAGLEEQVAALRHLLANMGTLDYHAGKGQRRRPATDGGTDG